MFAQTTMIATTVFAKASTNTRAAWVHASHLDVLETAVGARKQPSKTTTSVSMMLCVWVTIVAGPLCGLFARVHARRENQKVLFVIGNMNARVIIVITGGVLEFQKNIVH